MTAPATDSGASWPAGWQADRALAYIRLAAIPVIFAGERLVAHHPAQQSLFLPILAAATVYAVVALAVSHSRLGRTVPGSAYAALDLAFICALTYTSGGPFSQLRYAFFFLPLGAALLLRPRHTAAASLAAVLAFVLIALVHPATDDLDKAVRLELVQALYLVWMGLAAILLSVLLARRTDEVRELAASRGRLVAQALDAEDRERRRLAEALHDEAIQNLLAARQEVAAAGNGSTDLELIRLGLDRTIDQLRNAVFELHPYVLEHAGLTAALRAVVDQQARHSGFSWRVDVEPGAAGAHDQIVFSLARELIANAALHAEASELEVSVRRDAKAIILEVVDDGRGIAPGAAERAPRAGHIGLASCAERVEALDGRFEIRSSVARGTRVRAVLPVVA